MLQDLGLFLAQTVVKNPDNAAFFNDGIGGILQKIANILAILVVIVGLWQTGKAVVAGRGGAAVKSVIGTIILAAFMFNLQLMITLVTWMINVVGKFFDSFGKAFT